MQKFRRFSICIRYYQCSMISLCGLPLIPITESKTPAADECVVSFDDKRLSVNYGLHDGGENCSISRLRIIVLKNERYVLPNPFFEDV